MLTSFLPRVFCVLLLLQFPIWLISDALSPVVGQFIYKSNAAKVAADLNSAKKVTPKEITELSHKYHLNWIRVADNQKHVLMNSRPAGIGEPPGTAQNQVVDVKGARFFELTEALEGGSVSIGYACPSLTDSLFKQGTWPSQLSAGTILLAGCLNLAALAASYLFFVYKPLSRLNFKLREGQEPPDAFPFFVSSEITDNLKYVRSRLSNIRQEHDRAVSAARSDLSGAFAKEIEDRFVSQLSKDMVSMARVGDVAHKLIQNFSEEFSAIWKGAFGLDSDSMPGLRLMAQNGISDEQCKTLSQLDESSPLACAVKKYTTTTTVDVEKLEDAGLRQIAKDLGANQCVIGPVDFHGAYLAYFVLFLSSKDSQTVQKVERVLKRLVSELSPLWHLVSRYENAFWLSRHDPLTYAQNRICLDETLEIVKSNIAVGNTTGETIFLIVEGDNFKVMVNSFGPRTIDKLIQELSKTLLDTLEQTQRYKKSKMHFADLVFRIGGARFLVLLENTNIKKATEFAENLSKTFAEKKDWSAGLPSWTISSSITTLSTTGEYSPQDHLEEGMIALDYVHSRKNSNMIVLSKDVPEEYMNKALSRNQTGKISDFDPESILQDVAQSGKTGILTVESENGRVFWAYVDGGIPSKARLGALYGDGAVIEFASTFTEGAMRLQDLSTIDSQTAEDMRTLGVAYNIETPLLQLMEIAKDSKTTCADAKIILKTPELIVHPLVDREAKMVEKLYSKAGRPVSKIQVDITNRVWDLCSGRLSMDELVARLAECPENLVWTGAGFLMQNKLIKFSRLRVSSHTETAAEKEAASGSSKASNMTTTIMNFVSGPQPCPNCRAVDALSQKFCVHCGADMVKQ